MCLFLEDEIDGEYQKDKSDQVIHAEGFCFEKYQRENYEDYKRYHFLNYFELDQRKRSSIIFEPDPVGRDLYQIFKKKQYPS